MTKKKSETIKMEVIIKAFAQRKDGKAIITHVFDSISEFKRKIALRKHYKEILEAHALYMEERNKIVKELIERHVDEENKKPERKEKPLEVEKIRAVPDHLMPEFQEKHNELLDADSLCKPFKFTDKEVEGSGITISEMLLIDGFMPS